MRGCASCSAPSGSGQLAKMVNQICIAGLVQGLAEGIHFAKKAGLDIEALIATISKGAAQSWQMENRYKTMTAGKYDFGFAVDWMRKDLSICIAEARRNGANLPVAAWSISSTPRCRRWAAAAGTPRRCSRGSIAERERRGDVRICSCRSACWRKPAHPRPRRSLASPASRSCRIRSPARATSPICRRCSTSASRSARQIMPRGGEAARRRAAGLWQGRDRRRQWRHRARRGAAASQARRADASRGRRRRGDHLLQREGRGAGTPIDVPLAHKDNIWAFDYLDTMTVMVPTHRGPTRSWW